MARLNIGFEPVPEVAPTGAPGNDYFHIQAEPAAFGAPVAKGLQTLGQGIEHGAEAGFEVAQFFGRVNVDDQTNKFIDARNRILYGDPNKQTIGPDGKPAIDRGFMGLEGRAASDQRQSVLQQLQDARTAGLANLTTPRDRLAYDTETRRMYAEAEGHVGQHTDNQWKVWAQGVNHAGANHELDSFVNSLDDPAKARGYAQNFINFRVQQAQLKFGDDAQIKDEAAAEARRELLEAHVNYVAVKDPAGALQLLNKPENKAIAGVKYDDIANRLRSRSQVQNGVAAANYQIARATGLPGAGGPASGIASVRGDAAASLARQGIPLNVTSEDRTPEHNAAVGGASGSQHLFRNRAMDVSLNGLSPGQQQAVIDQFLSDPRVGGFGYYPNSNSIHVDVRSGGRTAWGGDYHSTSVGEGWPGWLTAKVQAWQGSSAPRAAPAAGDATYTPVAGGAATATGAPMPAIAGPSGATLGTPAPGMAPAAPDRHLQLAEALRGLESDPNLDDHEREVGRQRIQQEFRVLEIIDNQSTKAKREASDNAAGGYVTMLADLMHTPNPDYVALSGAIAHDPYLDWHAKEGLLDRVRRVSGEEQALSYGPGYLQAREALFSPPDAPGHINDFSQLVTRPDITEAGLRDLHTRLNLVKGDVDHGAVERRMNSYLRFAKKELSFEEDNGFFKLRDPKGEAIYSGQFEPDFVKRVSDLAQDAQRTGDRKKLDDFLSRESVQKMIDGYRSKREMAADRMAAQPAADQPEAANVPLPPVPEGSGISEAGWQQTMRKTPIGANGNPMSHALWADILTTLNSNPTPDVMSKFDRRYGPLGFQAADILKTINPAAAIAAEKTGHIGPEEAAKPEPAAPPAPAVPPAPEPPAPPAGETPEQRRERYRQESAAPVEKQQREAAERQAEQTARGPAEREAAFAATAERQEQRVNRPRLAEAQGERERQRTQERVADLRQQEQTLADNIRTWRRAQEDRNAAPADRDRAARRADKLQSELDAAKAEREKLSKP